MFYERHYYEWKSKKCRKSYIKKLPVITALYPEFIEAYVLKRKAASHFYRVVNTMKYPPNTLEQGTVALSQLDELIKNADKVTV